MNLKLLFVSIIATLPLTGCYQVANNVDLRKAAAFCGGVENIETVKVHFEGTERIKCIDGRDGFTGRIQLTPSKKSDTIQPEVNN